MPRKELRRSMRRGATATRVMGTAWLSFLLLCSACGSEKAPGEADVESSTDGRPGDATGEIACIGHACTSVSDCPAAGADNPCASGILCDGCCKHTYLPEGTPCDLGCTQGGTCQGSESFRECHGAVSKSCPDMDGNPCTAAWCDPATGETGECVGAGNEKPLADNTPIQSACWLGIVCVDGQPNKDNAVETDLKKTCDLKNEEVKKTSPYGCIDQIQCVDTEAECRAVLKNDGAECWVDGGTNGSTCLGNSCSAGECILDPSLNKECSQSDLPDECDAGCAVCTELTCHWIPDPSNPGGNKKVRYCKPDVQMKTPCDDGDDCTQEDACALGSQNVGPLGKETLGNCVAGELKECKSYPCAPSSCDPATGECKFDSLDDEWCKSNACLYPSDLNKCDPKSPEMDPATGCVFKAWKAEGTECKIDSACVESAACLKDSADPNGKKMICVGQVEKQCPDDGNPCTDDECVDQDGKAVCVHMPDDTNPCDDGNMCTKGELCVSGACVPGPQKACPDGNDNPCDGPKCVPETGECLDDEPMAEGEGCEWAGLCVVKACTAGQCVPVPLVSDGSPDLGDGLDNDCDGKVDENTYLEYSLTAGSWTSGGVVSADGGLQSVLGYPQALPDDCGATTDGSYSVYSLFGNKSK